MISRHLIALLGIRMKGHTPPFGNLDFNDLRRHGKGVVREGISRGPYDIVARSLVSLVNLSRGGR
ncbi:hypothetical protein BGAL_1037g00010 [Botrytis galanthina]|uniref:Uncharacterized protein n=1 Tax=Botrytis galanthina TaxID=278940 RepID=A0A4S8QGC0_9HELO|nr:hypothetical protein BGAL_1037g00010 [Botrytis galanthina]